MCVFCEMQDQIKALREISRGDPIIEAEIRVLENMGAVRMALLENTEMSDAVLSNPNAGAGAHARFACIKRHMAHLDDSINRMSEEMMRVIANGGPIVTLNTHTGKTH